MRCSARLRRDSAVGAVLKAIFIFTAVLGGCSAGPVNRASRFARNAIPLEGNLTSTQTGEACAVGDVVYMPGDTVPGSIPCELCTCRPSGGVQCAPIECEPKPGCKALHRPDHCCPLYQCECEQNGRVYANGEKSIDPVDPCRVCYCQGGDIVCNRLACFHREDCEPRYVAGRCCPEYDHCPPRDLKSDVRATDNSTTLLTKPLVLDTKTLDTTLDESSLAKHSSEPFENKREIEAKESKTAEVTNNSSKVNEIRIKEVTQKMEIPADTGITIKEIHPNFNKEMNQYIDSSVAPQTPREVDHNTQSPPNSASNKDKPENKSGVVYQSPPILRIGDQLVFLKVGDLVQESGSASTPSTVITVFGAEGLIRGEEEEFNENDNENETTTSPLDIAIISHEVSTIEVTTEAAKRVDGILKDTKSSKKVEIESTKYPTEKAQEITTLQNIPKIWTHKSTEQAMIDSNPEYPTITDYAHSEVEDVTEIITKEETKQTATDETALTPPNETVKGTTKEEIKLISTDEPTLTLPNETVKSTTKEETKQISIDDTALTLLSEIGKGTTIDKTKQIATDEAALALPNGNVKAVENNPTKVIPDVLYYLKDNETGTVVVSTISTLMPEEWFRGTTEQTIIKESSMLNMDAVLPKEILDSTSAPELKEGLDYNTDMEKNYRESDVLDELLIELRAPGEPLLIPEWERNATEISVTEPPYNFGNRKFDSDIFDAVSTIHTPGENLGTDHPEVSPMPNLKTIKPEISKETTQIEIILPEVKLEEQPIINLLPAEATEKNNDVTSPAEENFSQSTANTYIEPQEIHESTPTTYLKTGDSIKNKANILADLISLVGDVAAIGDHNEQEVSSKKVELVTQKEDIPITTVDYESRNIELSELTPFEDRDLPSEHKIEPTTQKTIIDNVSSSFNRNKNNMVPINDITSIIEIIPEVLSTSSDGEPKKIVEESQSKVTSKTFSHKGKKIIVNKEVETILPSENFSLTKNAKNNSDTATLSDSTYKNKPPSLADSGEDSEI